MWYTKRKPGPSWTSLFSSFCVRDKARPASLFSSWNPFPEQTMGYSALGESAYEKSANQQRLVLHQLDCWSLNTVLFKWKQGCATVHVCNQMIFLLSANFLSSYTHAHCILPPLTGKLLRVGALRVLQDRCAIKLCNFKHELLPESSNEHFQLCIIFLLTPD